ncbi:MAG: glycosyltransferase family 4 protein [Sedimentisphaerales bacterium]
MPSMAEEQIVSEVEQEVAKPPRTAIICSRRTITDYSLYLKYLLLGLADESAQVLLVAPPRVNIEAVVPPAFEAVRHPAVEFPLMQRYNRKALLERLAEFRPALLHCLCESMAALTSWLSRQLQIPYILNIDSISRPWHPVMISPTRCVGIIAPAKSIADHLVLVHPKYADRVRQINIGVFTAETVACFTHRDRVPGIVIAHPLTNAGDLDNIFQVFHRLGVENYQFMAAVIGADSAEKHIRNLLRELGLSRLVTFIGSLSGIDPAIAAADIFVVPRPSSGFNMALLAAQASGCAVAACKGGVDDLIIEDKTAVVFNPDDQLTIYSALKRLLDSPDFARQIAAQAQEYLRQNHHVSAMVASTLQLYREVSAEKQISKIKM